MAFGHFVPTNTRFKNLLGLTFGRLTVIAYAGNPGGIPLWDCSCQCGGTITTRGNSLKTGRTKSCGCLQSPRMSLETRFFRGIKKVPSGCILWISAPENHYGHIGRGNGEKKKFSTHRVSYEMFIGPIPDGLFVLHRCDIPACVNPAHLFLGTQAENISDMKSKGRGNDGRRNGSAKLDEKKVREIRERYATTQISHAALANEYGVCAETIRRVILQTIWDHV